MILAVSRRYRRLRFGAPIVVVSGLPRSGTSMMMRMLRAGGLEIVSDGVRAADDHNPRGYYEDERVKALNSGADPSWLEGARGKAIKIVSFLLRDLPETNNYKVIFMHRSMNEVLASQRKMLGAMAAAPDEPTDAALEREYRHHLNAVQRLLTGRACFEVINLEYQHVVDAPAEQAARIARFLGAELDVAHMVDAVDRALYRNRR